jgi:hypothetical protein
MKAQSAKARSIHLSAEDIEQARSAPLRLPRTGPGQLMLLQATTAALRAEVTRLQRQITQITSSNEPVMSTQATLKHYAGNAELPAWHLYTEGFDAADVIYLEFEGVRVDLETIDTEIIEGLQADASVLPRVRLRWPRATAKQLGLLIRADQQ